jgi:hypothetical protein
VGSGSTATARAWEATGSPNASAHPSTSSGTLPKATVMVTVTFADPAAVSSWLLLPMRLIAYNGGNRKLVITANTMELPEPVVMWLRESVQYRSWIGDVRPVSAAIPESEVFEL